MKAHETVGFTSLNKLNSIGADGGDSGGGQRIQDINFNSNLTESQKDDEPIFFDQTTRHIGSIQKNMVFFGRDESMNPNSNAWGDRNNPGKKAHRDGDDEEPNYSQFKQQNATYAIGPETIQEPAGYTYINTGDNFRDDRQMNGDGDMDTYNVVGTMQDTGEYNVYQDGT